MRELAAIGYTGDAFHRLAGSSPFRKMIAALWRESPVPRTPEGEQLTTMAALLHRDADGDALVTAWIKASPVDAETWVRAYLRAYLRPLVHCLHAYDLAFMPHGENLLLRLRDHVPVGAFMKDIGEEVAVMGPTPLPEEVERIRGSYPDDVKALAVHTDVFDGVLRFVAAILARMILPETNTTLQILLLTLVLINLGLWPMPYWLLAMVTLGPLLFYGSWPWIWYDTVARVFSWASMPKRR